MNIIFFIGKLGILNITFVPLILIKCLLNPKYERGSNNWEKRGRYEVFLDKADTIYAADYLLGYFNSQMDAGELMRLQKIENLKLNLWDNYQNPFLNEVTTISDGNIGVNIYFAGVRMMEERNNLPIISSLN